MGASYKENPKDIRSAYYLGVVAHEELKYKKAIKYYLSYLKYTQDDLDGVERYLVNWQLGRCYSAIKDYEMAKVTFQECIRRRWDLPLAYTTLAEIALLEARTMQESLENNGQARNHEFDERLVRKWR